MPLDDTVVPKIAALAKIKIQSEHHEKYRTQLNNILALAEKMESCNTDNIEPMTHPLDATLILREDSITQSDQREVFQSLAPESEQGVYLVPKVID